MNGGSMNGGSMNAADRPLRVSLLGVGALGGSLARQLGDGQIGGCTLARTIRSSTPADPAALLDCDVLVEAAGAPAARTWVPLALAAGLDIVLCSCGVLADPDFVAALAAGTDDRARVFIPSGAIGGLDLFAAASRAARGPALVPVPSPRATSVVLTTTKSPEALGVSTDSVVEVFRGSARAAALTHPKTANVAVALALATIGLDAVTVVMIADPCAARTRHVITMTSPLGDYELSVSNTVAPDSGGRTSAVTAWSVVTLLEALAAGHAAGVLVDPNATHQLEDIR